MRRIAVRAVVAFWVGIAGTAQGEELILVEKGVSRTPIVVSPADELAEYIEKISDARPQVVDGEVTITKRPALGPAAKAIYAKVKAARQP